VVVKQPVDKGILFKDKLPAEEYRRGKSLNNLRGDFHNLINYVNADFGNALGVQPVSSHKINVTADLNFSLRFKMTDFLRTFEITDVYDADLDKDEIFENAAE
jgi:hypothetical protein